MTRYFANFRTLDGTNPAFVELTADAFAKLASGRVVLMTQRGFAIYHGRGYMPGTPTPPDAEWLQFWDVPALALMPTDPMDQDAPMTVADMSEEQHATPVPTDPLPIMQKAIKAIDAMRLGITIHNSRQINRHIPIVGPVVNDLTDAMIELTNYVKNHDHR